MILRRRYLLAPLVLCAVIFPATAYAKAPSNAHLRFRVATMLTPAPPGNDSGDVGGFVYWTGGKSRTRGVSCCRNTVTDLATGQKWVTTRNRFPVILTLGGFKLRYKISSRDGRGRLVGSAITDAANTGYPDGYVDDQPSAGSLFSGSWLTTTSSRNYGTTVESSSTAGDSFTWDVYGDAVAWVAITGPNHGSAQIYVDGVLTKTISTYSKTAHYRRVVWAKAWGVFPFLPHTIKIVNVGTPDHPRISVDAMTYLGDD